MDFTVERRVLDPANDSNDPERIYMRNDYLMIFECQVKRKPSAYDYRRMINLAYDGIKAEIESLAANGFSIFIYIPGAPLENSRLSNGDYDLFSAAQKTGLACLGKYERDNVARERFRRYGLYQIPLSSLESAFFYQSVKWNCVIVLSQDRAFLSEQTLEKIVSLSGKDDLTRVRPPLDWHSITNHLCSSGAIIAREFGSFDDICRSVSLIGLRSSWKQLQTSSDFARKT